MGKVLYVDDEEENLNVFKSFFRSHYTLHLASSARQAKEVIKNNDIDLVITDQRMPGQTGVELLADLVKDFPDIVRIVVTGYSDLETVIRAINDGMVYQYISKPWDSAQLKIIIDKALEVRRLRRENSDLLASLQSSNRQLQEKNQILFDANAEIKKLKAQLENENKYLRQEISTQNNPNDIVYESKVFEDVLKKLHQVAPTNSTVLITGETGTGKELLARAIHNISNRSHKNLVKVNCAALPQNLIESELFGHVKGAFTGAINSKVGLFELADKGTIFLDEIGEMPLELQAKLLRVLQEGEFNRVGDSKTIRVDTRVIAATNRSMEESVSKGTFRSDLFFRLNVFPIHNPSLRERKGDIPALVNHFVQKHAKRIGRNITSIPRATISELMKHDWPGNIRELENTIERFIITSTDGELQVGDWKPVVFFHRTPSSSEASMSSAEKEHILQVLKKTNWKIRGPGGASELLNLKPTTLASKMKKLGILNKRTKGFSEDDADA